MRMINAEQFELIVIKTPKNIDEFSKDEAFSAGVTFVAELIDSAPTIDPETLPIVQELRAKLAKVTAERDAALTRIKELERCGKWDDSLDGITPYCSVCGCTHNCLKRKPLYCPNCGAKMDLNGV